MFTSRRDFIKSASIVSLGFFGLNEFVATGNTIHQGHGYGPLLPPGDGILSLPKGFSAKVISRKGDRMSDGLISPGMHDGMGVFRMDKAKMILIRNHENLPGADSMGPFGEGNKYIKKISKDRIYDDAKGERTCVGGTTTLVYNEQSQKVELEYLSLIGTVRNCAGGITPWNSWITCEETSVKTGDEDGFLEKALSKSLFKPQTRPGGNAKISLATE